MSVPVSIPGRSSSPGVVVLSTSPASSHCSRADLFGKAARVIAALRPSKAICTSYFNLCWKLLPTSVVNTPSFCCSSFRSGSGEFERRTSLHPRLRDKVRMSHSEMTDMKRELSTDASCATSAVGTTQLHVTSSIISNKHRTQCDSTQYPKPATSEPMKIRCYAVPSLTGDSRVVPSIRLHSRLDHVAGMFVPTLRFAHHSKELGPRELRLPRKDAPVWELSHTSEAQRGKTSANFCVDNWDWCFAEFSQFLHEGDNFSSLPKMDSECNCQPLLPPLPAERLATKEV